jgi:hypothetical protein
MKEPVKKVATRKNNDGSQQYESEAFRMKKDGVGNSKPLSTVKDDKDRKKAAQMTGRANAAAFMKSGVSRLSEMAKGSKEAKKRVGKPRGGK